MNTRRERRLEQREAEREAERRRRAQPQRSPWRSPLLLATVGAVIVGIILIGALVVANRPAPATSDIKPSEVLPPAAALIHGRSIGDENAPVTIELWSDFQCPVCLDFATLLEPQLRTSFLADGRARLVYRDFAFIGQESLDAAAAARIAEANGISFWTFHDLLYANQGQENKGGFSPSRLADIAVAAGMDRATFTAAFADHTYLDAVRAETAQGSAAGVQSTPTLVVNGTMYPGLPKMASLTSLIDSLQSPSPAPASTAP